MYCHKCGKRIPDGAKFCPACGAPQTEPQPAARPTPAPAQPPQPAPQAAPQSAPKSAPQPQKRAGLGLLLVVAAIAAAALGAFVIAPAMRGSGRDTDSPAQAVSQAQTEDAADSIPANARMVLDFTPAGFMGQMAPYLPTGITVTEQENGGRYAVTENSTGNEVAKFLFYAAGGGEATSPDSTAVTAVQFAYRRDFWIDKAEDATDIMAKVAQMCDPALRETDALSLVSGLLDTLHPGDGTGAATAASRSTQNDMVYELYHYVYNNGIEDVDEFSFEPTLMAEMAGLTGDTAAAGTDTAASVYMGRETNDAYTQLLARFGGASIFSPEDLAEGLSDPTLEFFARDNGDGSIECHDYAAEGDTVVKYFESTLLDLTGITAEQYEQTAALLTLQMEQLDKLGFVTASYTSDGTETGIVAVRCTDLDKEENRRTLYEMGIFPTDEPYSLAAIKQEELADGFLSLFQ